MAHRLLFHLQGDLLTISILIGGEMKSKLLLSLLVSLSSAISLAEETAATSPAQTTTGAPAQTATTLQAVEPAKKGPVIFKYINETRLKKSDYVAGGGEFEGLHIISLGYNANGTKFTLNPSWTSSSERTGSEATTFQLIDPYIKVGKNFKLNHDWSVDAAVRYYVPISAESKRISSNGLLRLEGEFKKPINDRFAFLLYTSLYQNLQKNLSSLEGTKTAMQKDTKMRGKSGASVPGSDAAEMYTSNRQYAWLNLAGVEYEISKKWSFQQWAGLYEKHYYSDPKRDITSTSQVNMLEVWSYFNYAASDNLAILLGLEQERAMETPDYKFMADNETKYFFSLIVGI